MVNVNNGFQIFPRNLCDLPFRLPYPPKKWIATGGKKVYDTTEIVFCEVPDESIPA